MKEEIINFIRYIITEDFGYPVIVTGDTRLSRDIGLDSLTIADLVMRIEDRFSVKIENYEIFKDSVDKIADYINSLIYGGKGMSNK